MFFKLFLLFTLVPLLELWLLLRVGEVIGPINTLLLVITTGAAGAALARRQGIEVLRRFQTSMATGELPHDPLIDGILILLGGAMLITPGVATDFVGLTLVIPLTRIPIRTALKKVLADRITMTATMGGPGGGFTYSSGPFPPGEQKQAPRHIPHKDNDDDIIDI